jgi:cytochrome c-type biogenesis protein
MLETLTLPIAFTAGLVSFFSPCFFPVIPGFFALMAAGEKEMKGGKVPSALRARVSNVYVSLAFIFGFAAVFFIVGSALQFSLDYYNLTFFRKTLATLGGFLIIFFGLVMMGVVPERFTNRFLGGSRRAGAGAGKVGGSLRRFVSPTVFKGISAFFFGAGFAAAWSPCIGAVLGSVLSLALANPETGLALFLAYVAGFGLPLIMLGFFADELSRYMAKFESKTLQIQSIFGAILVVAGLFMVLFPPEAVLKCF